MLQRLWILRNWIKKCININFRLEKIAFRLIKTKMNFK